MLWKCTVCGLISEGETPPEQCPKCKAPADKFESLSKEAEEKITTACKTNDLFMEICHYATKIDELCKEGLAIGLDPGCISSFTASKQRTCEIKQCCKAELASHVTKEKF